MTDHASDETGWNVTPMFQPNGWPLTDIPPGELRGMAREAAQ